MCLKELGQTVLPGPRHICALATAHKKLPKSLAKSHVLAAWMYQLEELSQQDEPFTCSHADLERAVRRVSEMSSQDARTLTHFVVSLLESKLHEEEYLEM